LEHIVGRMQADRSSDAPADLLRYARNIFKTRAAEPKLSVFERVLAVVKMDLAPNRAAFGERSAAGAQARQMLFDTGDNAVDLRITSSDAAFELRGQVLGGGFDGGEAVLAGEAFETTAAIDEASGFRLDGVPAGKYSLVLRGGGREIVIEELILG